ncbi:hypothetical protein Q4R45_20375, partial [Morganella morganii subsp. sibonii]
MADNRQNEKSLLTLPCALRRVIHDAHAFRFFAAYLPFTLAADGVTGTSALRFVVNKGGERFSTGAGADNRQNEKS